MKKAHEYYLKACNILGKKPIPTLEDRSDNDAVSADAYYRLIICIRYMNMIDGKVWIPIYDNNEFHCYPRWCKESPEKDSKLCFSDSDFSRWHSLTIVGPILEYRSYELMKQGIEILKPFYDDYFKQ